MNHERGIFDCSRSQYHNARYAEAATELGLDVHQVPNYGYALTTLSEGTAHRYRDELAGLSSVLVHRLHPGPRPNGPGTNPAGGDRSDDEAATVDRSRNRKATCACGFIIRVSNKTIAATVIRCDTCSTPFTLAR